MKKLKFISTVLMIFFVFGCSKDPIGFLEKGKKDFNAGHYLAAIDNLRHAKYFLPDNFEVVLYLGKAFLNYDEDKDAKYKARYYFKKASELARTSEECFDVKLTLLSLYRGKNRNSEIIETCIELLDNYKSLIKHKKEYEIKDMLAEAYFQTGSYDKAAALYQSIVTKYAEFLDDNPELHDMTNLRWTTTEILSDADDNIKEELDQIHSLKKCDYSSFSRNNKASAAICYQLIGGKLYKKDNYKDAIEYYKKSKELFVKVNDRDQISKVSIKLNRAYKKYDKNCKDYECKIREGRRLLSVTKYHKAVKSFKIALKNNKTEQQEADALLHLGIAFFLDNKFSDAFAEFEKLNNIYQKKRKCVADPDRLNLYYGLGSALEAVEELGVGLPVPGHALLHALERHGLVALHGEHRPLAGVGPHRREAEAAVADDDAGHAVPARE